MRIAEFYVPEGVMSAFATELAERKLENSITGATEDDEVIIYVRYDRDETDMVEELENILERMIEEYENDEEEENDED